MDVSSALSSFLAKHQSNKTLMNCFLISNSTKTTMLSGVIKEFDSKCIILDDCLIMLENIQSITPSRK